MCNIELTHCTSCAVSANPAAEDAQLQQQNKLHYSANKLKLFTTKNKDRTFIPLSRTRISCLLTEVGGKVFIFFFSLIHDNN